MSRAQNPKTHRKNCRSTVHPLSLPPLVQSPLVNERLQQSAEEEQRVRRDWGLLQLYPILFLMVLI